ncbi:MAG: hypothetical protein Q7R95_00500 [bacterium]|nr:hypothetical protein [bacterium]
MSYSNLYLKNHHRVPTTVLFLLIIFIFIFFIKIFSNNSTPSKASKIIVKRIEVTNLNMNQVDIYWQTESSSNGWIVYGPQNNKTASIAFDVRDLAENKGTYFNHLASLKNLQSNTQYFFTIIADNEMIKSNNELSFTTPADMKASSKSSLAYGKIIKSNGSPLENSIILINFKDSFLFSGLTKSTGEWLIPIENIYNKKDMKSRSPIPTEEISIEIVDNANSTTLISALVNQTSPLPQTIISGKSYNFITNTQVLSATTSNILAEKSLKDIDIMYPKENALIPGYSPIIKGIALPNSTLFITIEGKNRTTSSKTVSDNKGMWQIQLKERFTIGKYVILADTTDSHGNKVLIKRSFTIVANEGNDAQVLGVASGEPTLTLAPTIVPTVITQLSITPTQILINTSIKPTTPVTGSSVLAPTIGGVSLVILGLGILLAF